MSRKSAILSAVVIAPLMLVCLRLAWLYTMSGVEQAFAIEQVTIFYEFKQAYVEGRLSRAEAVDAVTSYYPAGSKQHPGTAMCMLVEKVRSEVIEDITESHDAAEADAE